MKYSKSFIPTLRQVPAEAEIVSHQLMLRAGYIRKVAAGVYSYLPLGWKVMKKIEDIIREEMDNAGANELMLPVVLPAELWQKSGRWNVYGDELWRVKDRHDRDFCLGPTHEEAITDLVANEVTSYKQLPLFLYQIQNKYRDERRPRFGLMRGREFVMKDCYSFDKDEAGLDESYRIMYEAYEHIFKRCGLDFRPVIADNGAIGGSASHEFMVLAESGEAEILYCDTCNYAANTEIATSKFDYEISNEELLSIEKIYTPNCRTIEAVCEYTGTPEINSLKSLCYIADEEFVLVLLRGDRRLNEIKLQNYLACNELNMATEDIIMEKIGLPTGFIGPVGVNGVRIVADDEVEYMVNAVCGANELDYHIKNVTSSRDFKAEYGQFRFIEVGEKCPCCEGRLKSARGIEVGQVFKLGTKYSETMGAIFLDENGKKNPMIMGCYGIGVGRTVAAAIEQNHDENGIIWPLAIAPYHIIVIPVNDKNEEQIKISNEIYEGLQKEGYDVLIDDRKERVGVKFKDADLIGIPIRITVGKDIVNGQVEFKRRDGEVQLINMSEVSEIIKKIFDQEA